MKRLFLIPLFFIVCFHAAFSNGKYSHYLNPEWLKGLNSTQKKIVLEEFERSANYLDEQNLTQAQKESKLKEMIGKLRDGFWVYRLSSMNQALLDSITVFNKATGLNVYVYSYLEDAGFLNNIFKRLSEAKYNEVTPDGYVSCRFVFKRTREPQGEEYIMAYAPSLSIETDQSDKLSQKLSELNTMGLNEFLGGTSSTNLTSEQLLDKRESCTKSLTKILDLMRNISYGSSASNYLSFDLLGVEMEPIKERITFITPAGSGITLPSGAKIVDGNYRGETVSPEGVLLGFKLAAGKIYMAKITSFGSFSGYYQYDEQARKFGQCYQDNETVVSGSKKIWYIKREEDESSQKCSLNIKEGTYNFIPEYSFKINCTKTYKVVSDSWHIWDYFKETSGGKQFLTPCVDKSVSSKPAAVTKNPLSKSLDDYAYDLHQYLKKKGIDGAVWMGACGENEQVQLVNQDQSVASTLSNAQAQKLVESGNFNTDVAIYGCYDKATGKWKIISNYKKGSVKPNPKFKGQISEEKANQISNEYIEKLAGQQSGKGGEAGGLQENTEGETERLPDGDEFKYDKLNLFAAAFAIKDFTKSIVENAKVPQQFWDNSPENLEIYLNSPVHVPAVLCGGGDQTIEELTGTIQLVYFGLDLATDPQKAKDMYKSLANMKWEDVKSATEKMAVSASGYENYAAGGCKARYQAGRHGVTLAMTVLAITKMAKVKEVFDKADEAVKEAAKNKLDDLNQLLSKWDKLNIEECRHLFNKLSKTEIKYTNKVTRSQKEIIDELDANPSSINPYNFAHKIEDITLSEDVIFIRAHNSLNPNRPWIMSIEECKSFSSKDDLIKKLAMPVLDNNGNIIGPTELSLVKVPAGTIVRKSVARPQDWPGQGHLPGGAIQFEIRENMDIPKSWFQRIGNINDFLK